MARGKKLGRTGLMPLLAWCAIEMWLQSAEAWLTAAAIQDRPPNSNLMLKALHAAAIPGIDASSARLVDGDASVEFEVEKPLGGTTTRKMDVEAAVLFALLLFSGGRLFLKISGDDKYVYFYGRLSIYDSGEEVLPYVSRVIANTAEGTQTGEGTEFRSWCRSEWTYQPQKAGDTGGKHGLEGAMAQAKAAFAKALRLTPDKLPPGLTGERHAELLDLAHRLLVRLPLKGQS